MTIERVQIPKRDEWLDGDGKFSLAGLQALGRLSDVFALKESLEVDGWAWLIESVEDKDYPVIINWPVAVEVNSVTTKSSTGTCTLTGKIDGVALGGTANSASTSEQEQAHTSANTVAVGSDFTLTASSNSSCENLSVTVKFTRAI